MPFDKFISVSNLPLFSSKEFISLRFLIPSLLNCFSKAKEEFLKEFWFFITLLVSSVISFIEEYSLDKFLVMLNDFEMSPDIDFWSEPKSWVDLVNNLV